MKCQDCCYNVISPEYPKGKCIWECRAPGDMPPCEEEDYYREEPYYEE
jgi:hypothetical protein